MKIYIRNLLLSQSCSSNVADGWGVCLCAGGSECGSTLLLEPPLAAQGPVHLPQ